MKFKLLASALLCLPVLLAMAQVDPVTKLSNLSLDELMDIKVVTASGYMQKTAEAPSTIQVVTSRQIAERGYEQLEDVLRDIPGIDMIHINGYAPTLIYFRGMYGAENLRALLMIDGIPENNIIGSNDMAGPAYSLQNVARVEIIWGPVSALYGSNAFGGVINIITKKGGEMNGIAAEKGAGTFNTSVERLSLGMKRSGLEIALSGSLYSTDGPKFTNRDPQYSASYVDKAYTLNGTLSYQSGALRTTLGYRAERTPMGWGTYANSPTQYLKLPSQGNLNQGILGILSRDFRGERSGLEDSYKRALFVQNEFKAGEKLDIFSRFVYRETGTGEDSYVYVTIDGKRLIRSPVATSSNRVSGEVTANYSLSEQQKITVGADFYQDNVEKGARQIKYDFSTLYLVDGRDTVVNLNATYLPRVFDIRTNFGSYFQYILSTALAGKTSFTLGARVDHNSYFGNAASPRIAVVNQPFTNLTFKLQFGTAFRAPTNIEIYQTPGGNFQLDKEKIKTYELNAIYTFSKSFRLQLNGFRNELTDVIVLANLAGLNPDKNPGAETINGLEANGDMVLSKNISGFMNFTLQHGRGINYVTNISGQVPGIARYKGNGGFTLHADSLLSLSLSGNWVGSRRSPRTDPYGPVPGYFLANLAFSTEKFFNNRVTASLIIHNVLDKKWLDPGFRTADGFLYSTVQEQPGRTALIKIGVRF